MTGQAKPILLTADSFIEWAAAEPRGRFELSRGEVAAMAPERLGHTRAKTEALIALRAAIAGRGVLCEVIADGVSMLDRLFHAVMRRGSHPRVNLPGRDGLLAHRRRA